MRKTDITLGSIMIGLSLFLFYMIFDLPPKAQIYPIFVTTLLLFLSVIHMIITLRKEKDEEEESPFTNIKKRQLGFIVGTSGIYVALISFTGYVTATALYMFSILIGLNTSKKMSVGVSIGFVSIIYILFKMILKVPLPRGFLI